jgi:hypothetical protein
VTSYHGRYTKDKVQTMKLTGIMISLPNIHRPQHPARYTLPGTWCLLFSESLYPSVLDNLHSRVLLGSILVSVQSSGLGVCN